ncbi:MAG: NAD(P)-dependent oxidoreductase [Spirochaetaceae bacterium]|nr:MAG: NAD(P)-dependent oxidoreductase [Spirochaetaceae bacterium]
MTLPDRIETEEQLEDVLTTPSRALVELASGLTGTIAVIGVGGKMGRTFAVRLSRAMKQSGANSRVIGISRFSDESCRSELERLGIETVTADANDISQVESLPDAQSVVYLVGRKFGTTGSEPETWAANTVPPVNVCRRYAGRPIVALSTGSVYDLSPVGAGGSTESDPTEPRGEYANAAVARERLFQWASARTQTPVCLVRLFYANDLRYGVIRDVADAIVEQRPIDVSVGSVNVIWQGDAVDHSIRALAYAAVPARPIIVAGPETVSIRYLAWRIAELLGREPYFVNESGPNALLGNAALAADLLGYPEVPLERMIRWTAHWVGLGGRGLGKPTNWEVKDGRY